MKHHSQYKWLIQALLDKRVREELVELLPSLQGDLDIESALDIGSIAMVIDRAGETVVACKIAETVLLEPPCPESSVTVIDWTDDQNPVPTPRAHTARAHTARALALTPNQVRAKRTAGTLFGKPRKVNP